MKSIIYYHSQSGSTALTVRYLAHKLTAVTCDLVDVAADPLPDLSQYDVVGFATWTYYLGLPPFFQHFLESLLPQTAKPAFLLSTYGMMPGQVLKRMDKTLTDKGFLVIGGHAFHTPESFPPYIVKGWDSLDAPTDQEQTEFDSFITGLDAKIAQIQANSHPDRAKIKLDLFSRIIRPTPIKKAVRKMGPLAVDAVLCTACGTCQDVCLYNAVRVDQSPTFDGANCHACYACFNHCPEGAIYTAKIRGEGQYPGPAETLVARLGENAR